MLYKTYRLCKHIQTQYANRHTLADGLMVMNHSLHRQPIKTRHKYTNAPATVDETHETKSIKGCNQENNKIRAG